MQKFNSITTERMRIRQVRPEDSEDIFRYRSLPEVNRYESFHPEDLTSVEEFIEKSETRINIPDTWFQLALVLKDKDILIGDIGLHFLPDIAQVEIGYALDPLFQGKGYAEEAVRGVLRYLFKELKKHRVIASVDPDNERSIHLLLKLGMRKEAHFKKSYLIGDEYYDDCIYALLDEEVLEEFK